MRKHETLMTKQRTTCALLTAVIFSSGFTFNKFTPVIAQTLDGDGGGPSDVCTLSPDEISGFYDFRAACINHDICYAKVRNRKLGREDLARCDIRFRGDMNRKCEEEWSGRRQIACKNAATVYYGFVRVYSRGVKI